jgi:hypothetical protein
MDLERIFSNGGKMRMGRMRIKAERLRMEKMVEKA